MIKKKATNTNSQGTLIIETEEVYTKETNNNEEEKNENEKGFMAHNNDLGPPNPNPDFKWQFILI